MSERDKIWVELYFSDEVREAARYLISGSMFTKGSPDLYEDLLSDALLKVFEKRDDFAQLHREGRLRGYVFQTMFSMVATRTARENGEAWARMDKWAQQYGLAERTGEFGVSYMLVEEESQTAPLDVKKDEVGHVTELFGGVSELAVRLMRKIHELDEQKETNPELWEAAQFTKLYLCYGSTRKVSKATGVDKNQISLYVERVKKLVSEVERLKVSVVTKGDEPVQGMELYRLYYPYFNGVAQFHKEDIEVKHVTYDYVEKQPALESDVYVFSRVQKQEQHVADKVLNQGKKFVLDLDDYWNLNSDHPYRNSPSNVDYVSTITSLMPRAHVVTTTTDRLADRMRKEYNVEPVVIKNTIPADADQFKGEKFQSGLVRFIWVGGVHHIKDLELLRPAVRKMYEDRSLYGKFQFVLAGYNPNEHFIKYESVLSSDYYGVRADQDYIDYLKLNTNALDHIGYFKPYRRVWARPVTTYGQGYREGCVALIPIVGGNLFNACKSELKLIEAGTTRTPVIVSDEHPYADHLQHEVNCLKVSGGNWFTHMRRLTMDADLRKELGDNLHEYVKKNFNHKTETNKLANALKRLK